MSVCQFYSSLHPDPRKTVHYYTSLQEWHYYRKVTVNKYCLTQILIIIMAKINFKPNEDRVLVEAAAAETKTASGIIIPDTAKEKPVQGKVIAIGDGLKDKPVTVKVGDKILYGK